MKRKYAEAIRRHGQPRGVISGDEDESEPEEYSDEDVDEAPPSKSRRQSATDEQPPWRARRHADADSPGSSNGHEADAYRLDAAAAFGAASLAMLMHSGVSLHLPLAPPPPHQLLQLATASALAQQGLAPAAPWQSLVQTVPTAMPLVPQAQTDSGSGSGGSGSYTAHASAVSSSSQGTTLCRPKPVRLHGGGAMLQQVYLRQQAVNAGQSGLTAVPQHWAGVVTSVASAG